MFDTLIVQPIFNLLVLIYGLLPGHNFGLAIILFTIVIRLLMWPLVKKQLHNARAMRQLQPELKRIKKETKGDRQREQLLMLELYKERKVNPFSTFGLVLVQLPIFLALYSGLNRIVKDPRAVIDFAYEPVRNLSWIKELGSNIDKFDNTLFGLVDLSRPALGAGGLYVPAMIIVVASVVIQYFQAKQLSPDDKDSRSLRQIMRDASSGKESEQAEVSAAVNRSTRFLLPGMIFIFTVNIASALSLYWLVSGLVAYWQQSRVLGQDESELETVAAREPSPDYIEGEVIASKPAKNKKPKKSSKANKRRKR